MDFDFLQPYCAWSHSSQSAYLYQGDCLRIMDEMIEANPNGYFDMIFADPPYFLSNGGVTCHSGKMVSVNKGRWDASSSLEDNQAFHLA